MTSESPHLSAGFLFMMQFAASGCSRSSSVKRQYHNAYTNTHANAADKIRHKIIMVENSAA
ncbi:MAG: hypothetical protein BGO70_07995 [Bacteroidetes bacterium 43-93]|nr:MAG: hypothetical protein BGO70_07995 [Bacteroidetes bacterium 43-93]